MQAVELRLPGNYWDSLLYNGRLYLFTRNGEIEVHNWDAIVTGLGWRDDLKPLAWHFLARGTAWYSTEVQQLLRSPATADHLSALAAELSSKQRIIGSRLLARSLERIVESPAHPHNDIVAYSNNVYVCGSSGVYEAALSHSDAMDFNRIIDAPTMRMAASYKTLALAAGSDGLLEQSLTERWDGSEATQLSGNYCQNCSWLRFDLVGTSHGDSPGFLAAFSNPNWLSDKGEASRSLLGIVDADQLFGRSEGYMFSAGDQLVLVHDGIMEMDAWNPYRRRKYSGVDIGHSLLTHETISNKRLRNSGTIIDAAASVFGFVIEQEESLLVLANDGTTKRLPEPVNWRCFPRSNRYVNHLHVTFEDHIRIYAFIHDYFLEGAERGPASNRPRSSFTA